MFGWGSFLGVVATTLIVRDQVVIVTEERFTLSDIIITDITCTLEAFA